MRGRFCALTMVLVLVTAIAFAARADDIEVREANLRAADEGLVLNAEFVFDFNARLADAVANGVPLYFVIEFELTRRRWYWLDERTASKRQQVRLSYHALSRHYRLSTGLLQQNFETLENALAVLRRVSNWLVVDRTVSLSDARYEAAVRMRLDLALLPRPIQISAYTSDDWHLESTWKRFPIRAPQQPPAPVESRESIEAPR
jgi:hypothetical protein